MLRAFPRGLAILPASGLFGSSNRAPLDRNGGMGTAYPDRARPITSPSIVRL